MKPRKLVGDTIENAVESCIHLTAGEGFCFGLAWHVMRLAVPELAAR